MHSIEANGANIPCLGLGTWTLSGRACSDLVAEAVAIGYRHIDTAAAYGNEDSVGEGIRAAGIERAALFVTTKVWPSDLRANDFRSSAEASLKRLGCDYVDLLLIHWPNPQVPLGETLAALNLARRDGLARHIGVSNFPTALLSQAIALSEAPLAANQVEHHPYLDQSRVGAACRAAGMAMVGYCPLHRGGQLFTEPAIARAALRYDKTPAQIVLRWHVQQNGVAAIPRTSKRERLAENMNIFDFTLDDTEMADIFALGRAHSRLCDFGFSPAWDAP